MGFGVNQYRSYEDGEVPSLSNARLIELAQKPENFHKLVLDKKSELKDRDFAEITQRIDELCKPKFTDCSSFLSTWQQEELPNHYTGYKLPDFEKFAQMVVFFYHREQSRYSLPS